MGCARTQYCPVFPHLNASLQGWRDVYCDSAEGWHDCERYRRFLAGEPVPLNMLPNGKIAVAIAPPAENAQPAGPAGAVYQGSGGPAAPLPWWRRLARRLRGSA